MKIIEVKNAPVPPPAPYGYVIEFGLDEMHLIARLLYWGEKGGRTFDTLPDEIQRWAREGGTHGRCK